MALTRQQIDAIEAAAAAFDTDIASGIARLGGGIGEYRRLLASQNQDSWKIRLAQLKRISPASFSKVLAAIPTDKKSELTAYVASKESQPLPDTVPVKPVSDLIDEGKVVLDSIPK